MCQTIFTYFKILWFFMEWFSAKHTMTYFPMTIYIQYIYIYIFYVPDLTPGLSFVPQPLSFIHTYICSVTPHCICPCISICKNTSGIWWLATASVIVVTAVCDSCLNKCKNNPNPNRYLEFHPELEQPTHHTMGVDNYMYIYIYIYVCAVSSLTNILEPTYDNMFLHW